MTLSELVDAYLDHLLAESPTVASFHGAPGDDSALPDLSATGFERRHAADDDFAAKFAALADDQLDHEGRIDRDLVLSHLRGGQIMRDWASWRRDPDVYLSPCLMGVFSLFLRRLHPEADLVRFAAARQRAVPEALANGQANLDAALADPMLLRRAVGQCQAGARYSRELLPAEVEDEAVRAELVEAGEIAAAAYESFGVFLGELADRATGTWMIGEPRYSALLHERELLGFGAAELKRRGQAAYDELAAELEVTARPMANDGEGFRDVLDRLAADHPADPEAMLEGYRHWTETARQFLVDNELVSFPDGETCEVEPSPPFQRPVLAVASYYRPPAFRRSLAGRFNVPYPPEGTEPDDIQKRLADNSYPSMPTTTVHEAYPGHHWHYARMQSEPRPLRMLINTAYFTEGWALYTERMMREQGFFTDPAHDLCHLDARLFRAARIVVDTSLHCGEMTVDEAVTFMREKAGLTEPVARAEVMRYCAWPTQAASYLTGAMEIERIRDRYLAEGRGDLRAFHDRAALSGSLPIALAERAVMGA